MMIIATESQFRLSVAVNIPEGGAMIDHIGGNGADPDLGPGISPESPDAVRIGIAPVGNYKIKLAVAINIQQGRGGLNGGIGVNDLLPFFGSVFTIQADHPSVKLTMKDLWFSVVINITNNGGRIRAASRGLPFFSTGCPVKTKRFWYTRTCKDYLWQTILINIIDQWCSIIAASSAELPEFTSVFSIQCVAFPIVHIAAENDLGLPITVDIAHGRLSECRRLGIKMPFDLRLLGIAVFTIEKNQ